MEANEHGERQLKRTEQSYHLHWTVCHHCDTTIWLNVLYYVPPSLHEADWAVDKLRNELISTVHSHFIWLVSLFDHCIADCDNIITPCVPFIAFLRHLSYCSHSLLIAMDPAAPQAALLLHWALRHQWLARLRLYHRPRLHLLCHQFHQLLSLHRFVRLRLPYPPQW